MLYMPSQVLGFGFSTFSLVPVQPVPAANVIEPGSTATVSSVPSTASVSKPSTMSGGKPSSSASKKAELLESLKGSVDHSSSCMCRELLPPLVPTQSHCGWFDLIDFDPCVDSDEFLNKKPLTEWTQVAHGSASEEQTILSEYRVYVSDESLTGFWTGLIVWRRDSNGYARCPFPGCDVRLYGKTAIHTLLQRHWKFQHARPYLCNVCGSSYATDGALKVHFFRTRHNEDVRSRLKLKTGRTKCLAQQTFSVHRREAIMRYVHKIERLVEENAGN